MMFLFNLIFIKKKRIVEKKFSNMALNNISSTIEQIKTRLEFLLKNDSTKQLDVRNYFLFFLKLFYEFLFN
jgi:hypothetical protein